MACSKLSPSSLYQSVDDSHATLYKLMEEADPMVCTEPPNDQPWRGRRHLPRVDADIMIISSYGDEYPSDVKVAKKLVPQDSTTDRLILARQELDHIQDLYKQDRTRQIIYCYSDHGTTQWSKGYYLERMEKLLLETDREWVYFFFTGDSEVSTGNWCFKDGVITFQDIYNLYIKHFSGKRLSIVSDCSYSGNWVRECAKVYDEQGILACGHHSRERGLLIAVSASCKAYQEATILTYVNEAMEVIVKDVKFLSNKTLSSGQATTRGNFTKISCKSKPDEQCQVTRSNQTWENKLLSHRVYIVRGEDGGSPAWCYVLVDEDKEQQFKDKAANRINVADYGTILYSGRGEDPPKDIKEKVNHRYDTNFQ